MTAPFFVYHGRMVMIRFVAVWMFVMLPMVSPARASDHAVVLLYHHVAVNTPPVTSVSPEQFARHLQYLARNHFHVLSLQELVERIEREEPLPEKSVAITFDDAYESVFTHAAPLLARYGWPYTVFVSTDYIDRRYGNYMSWQQMRQLKIQGGTFANHTLSHEHLVRRLPEESEMEWQKRVRRQIELAQKRLHQELGTEAKMFAYPYGEFSGPLQKLVGALGYVAFGQQSGVIGPAAAATAMPRFPLMGRYAESDDFILRVNARPLPIVLGDKVHTLLREGERRPRLVMRLGKGGFSHNGLNCFSQGRPISIQWLDRMAGIFAIRSESELPVGRSKYTCTAPATDEQGVYYWYSHLWILPKPDGSWPRESGQ